LPFRAEYADGAAAKQSTLLPALLLVVVVTVRILPLASEVLALLCGGRGGVGINLSVLGLLY
jgi:hypothetical protein